eukprot:TRINITY_DN378_c0_g1_i13.p1 TRINITY_DN378_c0_g1~~TRINITY_DN378_c0_g1_i13.p1  ORF type:complete len:164 (-),score=34.92 TRINITY_DN378_c0_g1_i13:66-557(-)
MGSTTNMGSAGLLLVLIFTGLNYISATDPREGRGGAPNVICGRWSNRVVNIGKNSAAEFEAGKSTKRCTVLYKLTDCKEMELTCSYLLIDNRDPDRCKKGNVFTVKAAGQQPKRFCKRDTLTSEFPARSRGTMKIWYTGTTGMLGTGRYMEQGVKCTVVCIKQ